MRGAGENAGYYEVLQGSLSLINNGTFKANNYVIDFTPNIKYFITNGDTTVDTYHSNVSEQNTVQINMSLDTNIKNKNVKTYFRYDLNGQVITVPLPFISKMEDGSIIAIQVKYVDNNCYIETNIVNVIPIDVTENNFYNDVTIIGVSSNKITYDEYKYDKIYYGKEEPLCLIDSQTKNDFVKQILTKEDGMVYIME